MFRILTVVPIPCAFTIFLPQTKMPYSVLSLKSNILMPLWITMREAKIPNSFALTNRLICVFLFFICSPQTTYRVSVMIWIRSYNGTKVQIGYICKHIHICIMKPVFLFIYFMFFMNHKSQSSHLVKKYKRGGRTVGFIDSFFSPLCLLEMKCETVKVKR